jgi:hypothetical protein
MWDTCGIARNETRLKEAAAEIPRIREAFWHDVTVPDSGEHLNQSLEDSRQDTLSRASPAIEVRVTLGISSRSIAIQQRRMRGIPHPRAIPPDSEVSLREIAVGRNRQQVENVAESHASTNSSHKITR